MFAFGGFGGNAVSNAAAPPPLPLPRSQQPAAAPFNAVLGSLPPGPGNGGDGVLPSPSGFGGAFPSHPPHHHQHGAFPMSGAAVPLHPAPIFDHLAPGSTAGAVPLSATPVFGGPPPSSAPVLSQSGGRAAGGGGGGGGGVLGGAEAGALRSAVAGQRPPPPPRSQRAAAPPAKSSGGDVADRGGSAASHLSNARPVFGAPAPPGGGGGAEAKPWLGTSMTSAMPAAASPAPTPFAATATPSVFGSVDKKSSGSGAGPSAGAAGGSGVLGSAFGTRTGAASGSAISAHAPPPAAAPSVLPSSSSVSSVFGASPPVSSATPAAAAPPPPPPSSPSSVFGAAALPSSSAPAPPPAPVFDKPEPHSRSHNNHNDRNSSSSTPAASGVLGATTASASPISSAFGSPSPKPTVTAAPQPPPPAATPSTSTGSNPFKPAFAPVAAAAPTASTSVFGLGATPTTSFTSATTSTAPLGPSGSVFASPARPAPPPAAKSSFGTSVPAAKGAAVSSAFPAAAPGGSAATAGRRRGRSPPQQQQQQQQRHDARAPPAQTTRVEPSVAQPTPHQQRRQQQQSQKALQRQQPGRPLRTINPSERLPIPSLPPDEKRICLAARVCKSFLLQLASASALGGGAVAADHSRDEDVARALEQAYFGVVGTEGVHGDFSRTAGEMLALWQGQVRPMLPASAAAAFPAELWIALFGLGTYLNTITATVTAAAKAGGGGGGGSSPAAPPAGSALPTGTDLATYKAGIRANPVAALTDACHYANELSELLQTLFQRGDDTNAPPYSIIPVVLRRVRSVFDEATARGVATVQSNLNAVTSKLFAVLNRRVKTSAVQPLNSPGAPARWLLTFDSTEKESLLHAFAYLIIEMIAADAPMSDDVELFTAAFHECFPAALAERCMLYYRRACALLRHSLSMPVVEEAAALLAKALAVYPPAAPPHNRRVLQVKLLAAEAALGRLPRDDAEWRALGVPQLIDIVNALKTARLDLLDVALKVHGAFYVEAGVHNVLCLARQRLALLMVVKYYLTHGCESRLSVQEMVRYHRLPYTAADAGMVWLLPLLMEKHMNGVLDHDFFILSGKSPFDAYPHPDLTTAAAALATR